MGRTRQFHVWLILGACSIGCANGQAPASGVEADSVVVPGRSTPVVRTGADALVAGGFEDLSGLRVGLIANHTTRTGEGHLGDLLAAAEQLDLVALFGPEHGIRGSAEAGESVRGGRDVRTNVPIHSLYGATRKPTPVMLEGLDVLVFDVQDVGARFYTYISTMGLAMQAAAERGIRFVVLDRPNPLGGRYVSGFVLEEPHRSFVGQFPIPIAHGMTVGELAEMIKGEAMLPGLEDLDLRVVRMSGWERDMTWQQTGLGWIAPSPNLPTLETALLFAGTCLFEALNASEGRGTTRPFELVGSPYLDGEEAAVQLNARKLPGVRFESTRFTPRSIAGMSSDPRFRDRELGGIRIVVTDPAALHPVETGIHVIDAFRTQARRSGAALVSRSEWLTTLAGTERLSAMLSRGAAPEEIIGAWKEEVARFDERRRKYLLYE